MVVSYLEEVVVVTLNRRPPLRGSFSNLFRNQVGYHVTVEPLEHFDRDSHLWCQQIRGDLF